MVQLQSIFLIQPLFFKLNLSNLYCQNKRISSEGFTIWTSIMRDYFGADWIMYILSYNNFL